MKRLVLLFAALLVAGCGEKSLSDSTIKKALEEAVELDSLLLRNGLYYLPNESKPYSGWAKEMYDSGQVEKLGKFKDGKPDGLVTGWHPNGQKRGEGTAKDGKQDGLQMAWHENGQKAAEATYKDGEKASGTFKYWNSKGEEVETYQESRK